MGWVFLVNRTRNQLHIVNLHSPDSERTGRFDSLDNSIFAGQPPILARGTSEQGSRVYAVGVRSNSHDVILARSSSGIF